MLQTVAHRYGSRRRVATAHWRVWLSTHRRGTAVSCTTARTSRGSHLRLAQRCDPAQRPAARRRLALQLYYEPSVQDCLDCRGTRGERHTPNVVWSSRTASTTCTRTSSSAHRARGLTITRSDASRFLSVPRQERPRRRPPVRAGLDTGIVLTLAAILRVAIGLDAAMRTRAPSAHLRRHYRLAIEAIAAPGTTSPSRCTRERAQRLLRDLLKRRATVGRAR